MEERKEESKEESKEAEPIEVAGMSTTSTSKYGSMRPAYRWILIGPARSGSTFHKVSHTATHTASPALPSCPLPLLSVECSSCPLPVPDGK